MSKGTTCFLLGAAFCGPVQRCQKLLLVLLQKGREPKQGHSTGGQPCEVRGLQGTVRLAPRSCVPNLPLPVQLSWAPGIKHDETDRKQNKQENHNNASLPRQQSSQTRSSRLLWLEHRFTTRRRAQASPCATKACLPALGSSATSQHFSSPLCSPGSPAP